MNVTAFVSLEGELLDYLNIELGNDDVRVSRVTSIGDSFLVTLSSNGTFSSSTRNLINATCGQEAIQHLPNFSGNYSLKLVECGMRMYENLDSTVTRPIEAAVDLYIKLSSPSTKNDRLVREDSSFSFEFIIFIFILILLFCCVIV